MVSLDAWLAQCTHFPPSPTHTRFFLSSCYQCFDLGCSRSEERQATLQPPTQPPQLPLWFVIYWWSQIWAEQLFSQEGCFLWCRCTLGRQQAIATLKLIHVARVMWCTWKEVIAFVWRLCVLVSIRALLFSFFARSFLGIFFLWTDSTDQTANDKSNIACSEHVNLYNGFQAGQCFCQHLVRTILCT